MSRDRHVHGHRTGRPGDTTACVVRVGDWPYDCIAKDRHPDHTVYICDTHACWWHEPRPLVVVTVASPSDRLGRCHFSAQWWTDNIGAACNETGWRGQHFHADPGEHAARWADRGYRVITRTAETEGDA